MSSNFNASSKLYSTSFEKLQVLLVALVSLLLIIFQFDLLASFIACTNAKTSHLTLSLANDAAFFDSTYGGNRRRFRLALVHPFYSFR